VTAKRFSGGMVFAVALLLAAGSALAQSPVPRGGGVDTSHVPPPRPRPDDGKAQESIQASVQFRLETLEEDLRIRPEQQKLWLNYKDRVLRLADDAQRTSRTALAGTMSAPERLDRLSDIARDRLTAIEDIVEAGKQLYAVLTPGQQGVADRRMAVPVTGLAGVEPSSSTVRTGSGNSR
jgi:LTXXQ motif family protein